MSVIPLNVSKSVLDKEIADAQVAINTGEATILSLSSAGHEVTEATEHLGQLREALTGLLKKRISEK
jgi:hypothetical protein